MWKSSTLYMDHSTLGNMQKQCNDWTSYSTYKETTVENILRYIKMIETNFHAKMHVTYTSFYSAMNKNAQGQKPWE